MSIGGTNTKADSGYISKAPRLGFVGGFDGFRGFGIMMVLFEHSYYKFAESVAGVIDVFFAMSAFLIMTLLMQEFRENGDLSLRKFYSRRAVRLLPSAYLCMVSWIVIALLFDRDRLSSILQEVAAGVLYVYHWVFPVGFGVLEPARYSKLEMSHFWSLSVEEQFYMVIAITALICLRRNWMKPLALLMVAGATFIGVQRFMGISGPWPGGPDVESAPARALSLLWLNRPDALMWGLALAVINGEMPDEMPPWLKKWLPVAGWASVVVLLATFFSSSLILKEIGDKVGIPVPFLEYAPKDTGGVNDGLYWIEFGHTVSAVAGCVMILALVRCVDWNFNRYLSWEPLRYLGRMSYTLYVWHTLFYFLVFYVVRLIFGYDKFPPGSEKIAPFLVIAALAGCWPVYKYVEKPLMKVKLRFASESETLDLNTGKMVKVDQSSSKDDE